MNLGESLRVLMARWRSVVTGLMIAIIAATATWMYVGPSYERTASIALVPVAETPDGMTANPFLMFDTLYAATDVVARAIGSPETLGDTVAEYPGATVEVERDASSSAPIILFRVTAPTDADAGRLLQAVLQRAAVTVEALQDADSIPRDGQVSVLPLAVDAHSTLEFRQRAIAGGIVGLSLTLLVIIVVVTIDELMRRVRYIEGASHLADEASRDDTVNSGDDGESVATLVGQRPAARAAGVSSKALTGNLAVTALTVYFVLLFAIPSNLTISLLGSLGRPSLLWGLVLALWWIITRILMPAPNLRQPIRFMFVAFLVTVLVSFAAAMLRGLPGDQLALSMSSIVRVVSWGGVLLVAVDGLRSRRDLRALIHRLVIAGGLLAALGLLQFTTGQSLLGWLDSLPGVSAEIGGVSDRGAFTRAAGTATHPLEYTATLGALLPLAIAWAAHTDQSFRRARAQSDSASDGAWLGQLARSWGPAVLIVLALLLSVSRSAMIGLAVAVVAVMPALPAAYRRLLTVGGIAAACALVLVVPGILSTTLGLFTESDASTASRASGLARIPDFISVNPIIGTGFGTFLPRYYVFDNQWALIIVELGLVGLVTFGGMVVAAFVAAIHAGRTARSSETSAYGYATAASVLTISVMMLFFDGLSFPISAGVLFICMGIAGSVRLVAARERRRNVTRRPELYTTTVGSQPAQPTER